MILGTRGKNSFLIAQVLGEDFLIFIFLEITINLKG